MLILLNLEGWEPPFVNTHFVKPRQ